MNQLLLYELEQNLGQSKHTSNSNYSFHCPKCKDTHPQHYHKKKLEIDIISENFNCWVCGFKGNALSKLYKSLKLDTTNLEKFVSLHKNEKHLIEVLPKISLPSEYNFLGEYPNKKFEKYLSNRGIDTIDIWKYRIGYCEYGYFKNRIVVPSFDANGHVNNFVARTILNDKEVWTYLKPKGVDEDNIINFEILIDWNKPVILCEGSFDAITIGDNAVPLFGKNISTKLLQKLLDSRSDKVYICLDKDALKSSLRIAEKLMRLGKNVYFVELNDKDPNQIGKDEMFEIIDNTEKLDLKGIMKIKLQI